MTEMQLLEERALALGLLEAAADAIVVTRTDGSIALVNRMAERLFGYDRAEMLGRPVEMLVPAPRRAEHVGLRDGFARTQRPRLMGELSAVEAQRKNGDMVPVEISLSPVETSVGRLTIAIVRDVTRRRELEEQLQFASTHDALTGLFNRAYVDQIRGALEKDAMPVGVILADIDGLKALNDRAGHEGGDQLIRRCALVLRSACEEHSVVARLGGDEFVALLPRASSASVEGTVARIREDLIQHNELTRGPPLGISIGAALTEKALGIADAMRLADRRMYDEKRARRAARADHA